MDPLHRLTRRLSKLSSAGTSANGQYKHDSGSGSGDAIHAAATVQDVITTSNEQNSQFLRLPAHLRQLIYQYVLGGVRIRVCDTHNCRRRHKCRNRGRKLHYATYFHLRRRHVALLSTCRQVHAEARLLPFSLNEFHGDHWDVQLAVYYRLTDAQVGAMTTLRVYFKYGDVVYYPALGPSNSSLSLGQDALATLRVLGHLRSLRTIIVEWVGYHDWAHDWPMVQRSMAFLVFEELQRVRRGADIEVQVTECSVVADSDISTETTVQNKQRLVSFML
ncbi:hypothetical protein ACJQWK_06134 [Exserohilum turcicum]